MTNIDTGARQQDLSNTRMRSIWKIPTVFVIQVNPDASYLA